ncbi:hypothetical protein B0T10DRAFT_452327 [Thelonectria olida]|uniref:F-box domain-containing protein n=1 Tax=Thelonectria olida TaxID=1576542 RepID=A0A9P8WL59_9HYPO|nr:hypothetical protein B0T10DRAFT_452327 [Thelonectria olida]
MSSETPKSAESAIKEARRHYAEKRFKPALEQFTRAMRLCPCARGRKRDRCTCKNFEKVASEGGSIFNEAMYNCKCSVGKTFNKCDKPLHILALNYRAATFEAIGEHGRAQKDAEWLLEIAPRELQGYLRLGKIAQLQKKYEFAWKKLYRLRQPLHHMFVRLDPLNHPREIVQRIFQHLDFPSLVRCLRVSKAWRRYLSGRGNEFLWRTLAFTQKYPHRFAPSLRALKNLMSYSGNDTRELIIGDALRFRLNQQKLLGICQGSKNLVRLTIGGATTERLQVPQNPQVLTKLTHIDLRDNVGEQTGLLTPLLCNASENLQSVSIAGLPQIGSRTDLAFPHLPALKYLRLEEHGRPYPLRLEIFIVADKTPNLEQLWLSDIQLGSGGLQEEQLDIVWPNLKTVIINASTDTDPETSENITRLTSIRRGTSLRHIDFDFRWKYDELSPLGLRMLSNLLNHEPASIANAREANEYRELRTLRLSRALIAPDSLQGALQQSLSAGRLESLDIVFPLEPIGVAPGTTSVQHIREFAWLRGASSIRCLGLFEFRFHTYYTGDKDFPLPSFLASFPNLETLDIKSGHYESDEFFVVLRDILRVNTNIKRVYQMSVHGVALDELRRITASAGVELIWGERPREWPMKVDDGEV